MKKGMIALSLVLVVGMFSAFAYADSPIGNQDFHMGNFGNSERMQWDVDSEQFQKWEEDKLQYRKDNLKRAVEEKVITEEEAKKWEEHFKYEDKFHEENGYLNNHCGGGFSENGRRGMGSRHMGW